MFKKYLLGLINFISLYVIAVSCNTTEPPIIDNIPAGKRDYVWSIDSIDYGNIPSLIQLESCLLYTSPSPRDRTRSRMPSSA